MRKILGILVSMLFASNAFGFDFATYSKNSTGSINVTIQQGVSKIKFSTQGVKNMDTLDPFKDGFAFTITGAGALAKGSCTIEASGLERCENVTVDSAAQTTITISSNGKGGGDLHTGSGGVDWVYQGLGANVILQPGYPQSSGLASGSAPLGHSCTPGAVWCTGQTAQLQAILSNICTREFGFDPC